MSLNPDLANELKSAGLEVRSDPAARLLYATDASIYQIEPLGVAFPRDDEQLQAAIELAARYQTPILARGAGSSLAGQAVAHALVLDCSRYLNHILKLDGENRSAVVEPGVVLASLNKAAAAHGLQFGPDPASAERATLGGSLANNATGAHSVWYGMAADHLLSVDLVLADGSAARFEPIALSEAQRRAGQTGRLAIDHAPAALHAMDAYPVNLEEAIYSAALHIRSAYAEDIRRSWPRIWRRASGYNINYLLPWSPAAPPGWNAWPRSDTGGDLYPPVIPGEINLAPLLAGSEGTLAVIRRAEVRLVPKPKHKLLVILGYATITQACAAAPELLGYAPSAVELIPQTLVRLARAVPAYAQLTAFVDELPGGREAEALLVVEFAGDDPRAVEALARRLMQTSAPNHLLVAAPARQKQVWDVRTVGLGILSSRRGALKSTAFMEDVAVPVDLLSGYVENLERLFSQHGVQADYYAHASAGCLHIRPMLNLKDPAGRAKLRALAEGALEIALALGGAASGEHGDGLSRSEWLPRTFGEPVMQAFRLLKKAADPFGLLNPGKLPDTPPMDAGLRIDAYQQETGWAPVMDFSSYDNEAARGGGLLGAVEMCNGAGVCRKDGGVMCPSFQATRDETHSTRGRANLLRALITGQFPDRMAGEKAVYEALELCLACKGCAAECPSAVDMPRLKYEFMHYFYKQGYARRRLRDYLFAYIERFARLGQPLHALANSLLSWAPLRTLAEQRLGISAARPLPQLAARRFSEHFRSGQPAGSGSTLLLLSDAFTEYFHPQAGVAALSLLKAAGVHVVLLPVLGAGRTLLSKGFVPEAQAHARRLVRAIRERDPGGILPVAGIEPSEIYTLCDEYPDLLPGDEYVLGLAKRAWMLDEYLIRQPGPVWETDNCKAGPILLHGHCYQKARPPAADGLPVGQAACAQLLRTAGYDVQVIDSGCCGMAGAFGYEAEHHALSMQVGELSLLTAIRAVPGAKVAAAGVSCQAQIADGSGAPVKHPLEWAAESLALQGESV